MTANPSPTSAGASVASPRQALARAVGLSAFVFGYPLIESMRTCRLQTTEGADLRAPIDALHHIRHASTDRDRDVVTPANDLLYTTAWIHLADGPRLLTVPAAARHPGRYFVLALYDAWTENFENLGPRNCQAEGETVLLLGPGGAVPAGLEGHRVVHCPTNLVWLIGRILIGDEADGPAARALQDEIALVPAPDAGRGSRPLAVERWMGEPVDAMAEVWEQQRLPIEVAPRFFTALCHALADTRARTEDAGMLAWLGQSGLVPGAHFQWEALDPAQRAGLVEGFADAVSLVATAARSRHTRPWVLASRAGRYGNDYLTRALTAYIGLGALATAEALYGAGHFDARQRPLTGERRYRLRFEPGELPPAEAFWSVTLYDADRFLATNTIGRHSIGDRTPGLRLEADGALEIDFAHLSPTDTRNWLPTPPGPFYLILRLYHPREGARNWRIPALEPLEG